MLSRLHLDEFVVIVGEFWFRKIVLIHNLEKYVKHIYSVVTGFIHFIISLCLTQQNYDVKFIYPNKK